MSAPGTRRSTLTPASFALQLSHYTWHLIQQSQGDRSGRWLAARTDRSKSYWSKVLTFRQALNANDIQLIAELFTTSPFDFIRDAQEWLATQAAASPTLDK